MQNLEEIYKELLSLREEVKILKQEKQDFINKCNISTSKEVVKDLNYYKNLNLFDEEQLNCIECGLINNFNVEIYAKKEYDYKQMYYIYYGSLNKLDINYYLNPSYSYELMREIYWILYNNENLNKKELKNKINKVIKNHK